MATAPPGAMPGKMADPIAENNGKKAKPKGLLAGLIVLSVLVLGGIVGYYSYQGANFVSSDDAYVDGNLVYVYPPAPGQLDSWTAQVGQRVHQGETIGTETVDNLSGSQSTAPEPAAVGAAIEAPIDGVVVQSSAVPGSFVSPQGGALAAVADTNNLWIQANIEETSVHQIKTGDLVRVTVDARPGLSFLGQVSSVEQATQASESLIPDLSSGGTFTKVTQRVPVNIRLFGYRNQGLAVGLDAEVQILLNHHDPLYRQVLGNPNSAKKGAR